MIIARAKTCGSLRLALMCLGLLCSSCSDHLGNPGDAPEPEPFDPARCPYAEAPDGDGALLHVCAEAGVGAPDGTTQAPYPLVSDALAAAESGARVLVSGGTYREALQIGIPVSVVGLPGETTLAVTADARGVNVTASGLVELSNLSVEGATEVGIQVNGGALSLVKVSVRGTVADAAGAAGHGVVARDGAVLELADVTVLSSAGQGVTADGSTVRIQASLISGSGRGGVRAQGGHLDLDNTTLSDNAAFGVAFVNAGGRVDGGVIRQTRVDGDARGGDGLVISSLQGQAPSVEPVEVRGVEMLDNARFGALVDRRQQVVLDTNQVRANLGGGIWAQRPGQGEARIVLRNNQLEANARVGIVVSGAPVDLIENVIAGTQAGFIRGDTVIGDAVGIYAGADVLATKNTFAGSARAGAVVDDAAATFSENTIDEAQLAIVAQRGGAAIDGGGNVFGDAEGIVSLAPADALPVFDALAP